MSRYQPALLGGLFIGVLSSLPLISAANCCCLWVISGGVLTTYLLQQRTPEAIQTSDALLQGLLAGVIGGIITALANAVIFDAATKMAEFQQAFERPDMPQEVRDMMMWLTTGRSRALLMDGVIVPLYAIFGMLGGLLGTAFFKKKTPPAAPMPPPVQPGV